jgi:hypothetical protein
VRITYVNTTTMWVLTRDCLTSRSVLSILATVVLRLLEAAAEIPIVRFSGSRVRESRPEVAARSAPVLKGSSGSVSLKAEGDGRPTDDDSLAASPRTSVDSMSPRDGFLGLDVSLDREARPDAGGLSEECDENGEADPGGDRDWEPSSSSPPMGSNFLDG